MKCYDIATIKEKSIVCNAVIAKFSEEKEACLVEGVEFVNCKFESSVYLVDFFNCKFIGTEADFYFDRLGAYKNCSFM